MAYQAARAMADNHIGAVLVSQPGGIAGIVTDRDLALAVLGGELDPKTTPLREVMSEQVVACDIDADLDQVVKLMQDNGVRRIPLVEAGRPVGLVTFDDLILDGAADLQALRGIVVAQLEVEAPQKPAGMLYPKAATTPQRRVRALMRAKARAEATYGRMVGAVAAVGKLDRGRAERALLLATCMLCRRLTADQALHLIAQLPSMLQSRLEECVGEPDRSVTAQTLKDELARSLGMTPESANDSLRAVFRVVSETVSAGQIKEVRGQLPEEIRMLFPAPA